MKTYYFSEAIPLVEEYFKAQYTSMPKPGNYWYIVTGDQVSSTCGVIPDTAYAYCPADENVYVGQETLWDLYSRFGAAGPIVGLAHEWGHHVQTIARVPVPQTYAETIVHEDQADCVAGAWVNYADSKKYIEYPKDIVNITDLFIAIGEAEGPKQSHGTPSERLTSFNLGFTGGLQACNGFYPANPILTTA